MKLRIARIPVVEPARPEVVSKSFLFFETDDGGTSLPLASDDNENYIKDFASRFLALLSQYRDDTKHVFVEVRSLTPNQEAMCQKN